MVVKAGVTKAGILDMQVCVPNKWTDEQAIAFAERENPCGTEFGWIIRLEGDTALNGDPERNQCLKHKDNVHIVLDA